MVWRSLSWWIFHFPINASHCRLAEKQDKSLSDPRNFLSLYYIHCKKCDFVNMEREIFSKNLLSAIRLQLTGRQPAA